MTINEEKNQVLRGLRTIASELGCNDRHIENMAYHELLDIIVKDIHIRRILIEADKKKIRRLTRELEALRQVGFGFYNTMKEYN